MNVPANSKYPAFINHNLVDNRLIVVFLTVEFFFIGYFLFFTKSFNYDEFESIHAGWKILTGEKIYTEFQEIHHPALYYFLSIIILIFGSNIATVFISRFIIFILATGILYCVYQIARKIFDCDTARFSILLLPLIPWFNLSVFEIRPDVPMLLCSLASYLYLYKYIDNQNSRDLFICSILSGISLLFLQKAIFYISLAGLIILARIIRRNLSLKAILLFSALNISVYLLFLVFINYTSSLNDYFFFCLEFANLRREHLGAGNNIDYIITEITQVDRFAWLLAPAFLLTLIKTKYNDKKIEFIFATAWLVLPVYFSVVPYDHSYLPLTIFSAIIIGHGVSKLREVLGGKKFLIFLSVVVLTGIYNYARITPEGSQNLQDQIDRVKYALINSGENEYVYDGCNMFNLFRKDLDFFWFIGHDSVPSYATYMEFRNYEYDIYNLIKTKQPALISPCFIDFDAHPQLLTEYRQSVRNPYFYHKYNNTTGYNFWHSFKDNLDMGSRVIPEWDYFTESGDIEVEFVKSADPETPNAGKYPYVGIAMEFNSPPAPVSLISSAGIKITYKLSGTLSMILSQENMTYGNEFRVNLAPVTAYTEKTYKWTDFKPPVWSKDESLDLKKITGIKFQVTTKGAGHAKFGLRAIKFIGNEIPVNNQASDPGRLAERPHL